MMSLSKAALENLAQLADKIPPKPSEKPTVTDSTAAPSPNREKSSTPDDVISIHASLGWPRVLNEKRYRVANLTVILNRYKNPFAKV